MSIPTELPTVDKPVGDLTNAELLTYIVQLRKITQAARGWVSEELRSRALLAIGPCFSEANTRHLSTGEPIE
jgi:hypothetical protein